MTLLESAEAPEKPSSQKAAATPKAVLNQKYGNKASYRTEAVHDESTRNACPGVAIPQQVQCKFRCHLELPKFTVVSDVCTRKKDAEQSAAKMALEKLGIISSTHSRTIGEQWEELVDHISFLFRDEFLSSAHPLAAHFRSALMQKSGILNIPASILPVCDAKIYNLCKSIDPNAEVDPLILAALVMKAVRQCDCLASLTGKLWISRKALYPTEVVNLLAEKHPLSAENIKTGVVYIPFALEKPVEVLDLDVPPYVYYMDVIAQKLCACDSSQVVISRSIGKSSSETRLHFPAPDGSLDHESSFADVSTFKDGVHLQPHLNVRASYFSAQNIYGDAILATLGYTWRSTGLFHQTVSLNSYYRMLLSRVPDGNYKLSRDAVLVAEMPVDFTTRSNWRGSFPRDLLRMFCHQNHLAKPVFSIGSAEPPGPSMMHKISKLESPISEELMSNMLNGEKDGREKESGTEGISTHLYRCSVRVLSKKEDVILECFPTNLYRSKNDAVQNVSLKVMTWLNNFFKLGVLDDDKSSPEDANGVNVSFSRFSEELSQQIALYRSLYTSLGNGVSSSLTSVDDQPNILQENGKTHFNIEGPDSGTYASNGSLACISYSIFLLNEHQKMHIDSKDKFEFEVGSGSVISSLEECVSQMSADQVARFVTPLPCALLLASASEAAATYSSCCPYAGSLEYCIKLLQITEPMEDRMEQAFFSPPLSKQRVECALRYIRESSATTLVDFGCGSGSLLDALFQHETTLEKVAGVDISQKSLCRAAKMLYSKLGRGDESIVQTKGINVAVLYEGSITEFDSRICGYDIGTCLEVIEHMEEEQACVFGDLVLSSFCPRILIVSTPNHEYNAILQRNSTDTTSLPTIESQEGTQGQSYRFRNHDHKFEWTRSQFNQWAIGLASRHDYSVEITGVGGSENIEPGFASQIAVFRRNASDSATNSCSNVESSSHIYEVRWEWGSGF